MSLDKLRNLYRQIILDHANHPHNHLHIAHPTCAMTLNNPTCGDTITVEIEVVDQHIRSIGFTGHGCTISQASASMMTEAVKGKAIKQALAMAKIFSDMAIGHEHSASDLAQLQDAQVLTNIMQFPARIKCATLAWWTLERALAKNGEHQNE